MNDFFHRVKAFNQMYGLDTPSVPGLDERFPGRLERFQEILSDELLEAADVIKPEEIDTLTNLADWLCDIIVYCSSECQRHGIPTEMVLSIIMDSNESKLGADGLPIVVDGKVQKGPNYWKPEPKIKELLESLRRYA